MCTKIINKTWANRKYLNPHEHGLVSKTVNINPREH